MPRAKTLKLCFFLLILMFLGAESIAQRFLVLEKMGTRKRFEYYPGDRIKYKIKNQKGFRNEEILAIGDSALMLDNSGEMPFKMIERVNLTQFKGAWIGIGGTFVLAGIVLFSIDYFNQQVVAGNSNPGVDTGVATASALLAGAGVAMIVSGTKKVRVRKNWRMRVVDIYGGG